MGSGLSTHETGLDRGSMVTWLIETTGGFLETGERTPGDMALVLTVMLLKMQQLAYPTAEIERLQRHLGTVCTRARRAAA